MGGQHSSGPGGPDMFRVCFEAAPSLCLLLTPDLRIVGATDAYLRATLTSREGLIGRDLFEAFPDNPNTPAATGTRNLGRSLRRVLEERRPDIMVVQRYDIRRPDGTFVERYWRPLNTPVLAPDGSVAYIIHHVEDVTEAEQLRRDSAVSQRRADDAAQRETALEALRAGDEARRQAAELALRQSDGWLSLTLAATNVGTWRWDVTTDTVVLSDRAWELLGAPADRSNLAAAYRAAIHPHDYDRVMAEVQRTIREGGEYDVEYRVMEPTGEVRWVGARGRAEMGPQGQTVRMHGVIMDISHRVASDQAQRDKLEHDRDAAELASRAKTGFLAYMSHEIRTPINGIVGIIELLEGTALSEAQRRYVELARRAADSLRAVISDVLDLSQVEAGKLELSPARADLHLLVDDVSELMAQKAARKGLELASSVHRSVPRHVRIDEGRVRQVLVNLLSNAIKYTSRGEVIVRATLDRQRGPSAVVRFTVTDTGVGIPADRIGTLFNEFSRVQMDLPRTHASSGLGLAISKRLVELMGGDIGVTSEPGRGSTFWFTVECELLPAPEPEAKPAIDPTSLRVLAVDDSRTQREILRDHLASWGMQAAAAKDGPEGLSLLTGAAEQGTPFTLALVDQNMPAMSGAEFAGHVRANPTTSGTVLMILVGNAGTLEPEALRAMGFDGQISKPVRQSALLDAIMNVLGAARKSALVAGGAGTKPVTGEGVKARILVIEDNEVNQVVARDILIRGGYACSVAGDAEMALGMLEAEPFDLVLMDCQLPTMSGFEATARIRQIEARRPLNPRSPRHMPIVALTANAFKGDRERCIEAGMDGYLSKPINTERMFRTIEGFLKPAPGQDAPFSLSGVLRWCGGEPGAARAILDTFERVLRGDLDRLATVSADITHIAKLAHTIRSAAAVVVAPALIIACGTTEDQARAGDLDSAVASLAELRAEVARCLEHLPQVRSELGALMSTSR